MMIQNEKTNNLFQLYHFKYWYQSTKLLILRTRIRKKSHIVTHYKICVHNHCKLVFFLSECISSFSQRVLQPVSDFPNTYTAEVFPLNSTAHCDKSSPLIPAVLTECICWGCTTSDML